MNTASCIVCGKPRGSNLKFCSRSCAAIHNNKVRPKRRPSGICGRCGDAIQKGKRYCEKCRVLIAAEKQLETDLKLENVRSWHTLSGDKTERSILRVPRSEEIVFNAGATGTNRLTLDDPVGDLLEYLIAICFSSPQYLRREAAARYVVLLSELRDFRLDCEWDRRFHGKNVADLPIRVLSFCLYEWVKSYFFGEHHPLMPHYALDTARLIEHHAKGHFDFKPEYWRIEPLVEMSQGDRESVEVADSRFKKEFTEATGEIFVIAALPDGAKLRHYSEDVAGDGTTVLFRFDRCYLSQGWCDNLVMTAEDATAPTYDLMDEFSFFGDYLVSPKAEGNCFLPSSVQVAENLVRTVEQFQAAERLGCVHGMLPAAWITDVLDVHPFGRSRPITLMPVSIWEAELDQPNS